MVGSRGRGTLLLCLVLASGCASRFRGDAHAEASYDFAGVRALAITEPARNLPPDARVVRNLVEGALRRQLQAKGYRVTPGDEADLVVVVHAGLYAKTRISGAASIEGTEARMTLQFREPATHHSVWYGWTQETWRDSMDPAPEIEEAVAFLLDRFPDASRSTR